MRFTKGTPKPAGSGKKKGSVNKATEAARKLVSEADDKAIVDRVLEQAKGGDIAAIGLYFRYLRPPAPRVTYVSQIAYRAPKTVIDARQLIIVLGERLANGELPIEAPRRARLRLTRLPRRQGGRAAKDA